MQKIPELQFCFARLVLGFVHYRQIEDGFLG